MQPTADRSTAHLHIGHLTLHVLVFDDVLRIALRVVVDDKLTVLETGGRVVLHRVANHRVVLGPRQQTSAVRWP